MARDVVVLYVDDEVINLFLFEQSFKNSYKILTAESGDAGLRKLEDFQNDIIVVISDMRMPGMNGIEFIKKAKIKFKNIAYYILTAYNFNEEFEAAIEGKLVDKIFSKPFDISEIKFEVDRVAAQFEE